MIACDLTRFEALCANGSQNALGEAVTRYGDSLLAEIAIQEEAWTLWLGSERAAGGPGTRCHGQAR